jgi:hypothetical protein
VNDSECGNLVGVAGVEERVKYAAMTLVAAAVIGLVAAPALAATVPPYRMTPSDRTVLPGQQVTITVDGPGVERWGGGVDSYFERRRDDGTWQRLYQLVWWGENRGGPWVVSDPNSDVVALAVQASPFQVLIPAVKPGVYRITRQFGMDPGYSQDKKTLSTRVTVAACPKGQRPSFTPPEPTPTGYQHGTPMCAAKSR